MRLLFYIFISFLLIFKLFSNSQRIVGDMNGDGIVNLVDTIKMVNHIHGTGFTTELETLKWQADINGDGLVNSFDVESSLEFVFKRESIKSLPFAGIINTFPYAGEGDISLTREFVIHFNMPLAQGTVLTNDAFFAYSGDSLQVTSARLSSDRMKATLFLNGFRWPSNSTVTVTLNGGGLTDFIGRGIDVDGDGVEGGIKTWTFSTLGVEASDPSTIVEGQVFDSDNSNGEKPLPGVLITVVGNEEAMSVLTDSNGSFQLTSAPIGRFFVMVDGRLVGAPNGETLVQGSWRNRDYYTFVGKAWEAVPGKKVKATKYGKFAENGTYIPDPRDGKIFLPLVKKGALKPVDATKQTNISFVSGYLDGNDSNLMSMLAATSITIPPGSLQSDDGTTGGSVGMAPVAPDRLPEPLPESLKMPLVITIQTDGPSNFDIPVPARFPNVDNLPPGAKSALWSFDHDTGVWEISGPMTVSADGKFLETDPGVGIRQPGWHGTSPGAQVFGKAVTTGPSIAKPKKGACGLSHASMAITEGDFTNLGRLSEGIEESIFGQNESDLSFSKDVLGAGNRFGNTQNAGGSDWKQFRTHAEKDATLHSTIARTVSTLLGSEDFWTTFSTTASTIRDNAIIASKNSSAQTKINSAHQVFINDLNRAKAKISSQISKWENYSVSLSALIGQTTGISGHAVLQTDRSLIAKEISSTLKAYRSIPGGNSRLDEQLKKFAQSWQKFLQATLNGNLHIYKGESFVFLKRIGSEAEETRVPPIAAQRIRVGSGGSYDAIVRPNSWYEAWMLEPTTLVIGSTTFISPRNGGNGPVPPIPLCHDDKPDSDFDYLSDRGERIVGTNKSQPDTDGDGIPDGFEILNGTDPSGGNPVFTGILATIAPTRGFSDFVTTGNDLAILGNGPSGVDIFDIGSGVRPIKQSTYNTPGSVRKAALSENYLVIADGSAGLTVLDLTSIESPSQIWNIPQESPANAVAVAGKIAFIGLENGKIKSYDLFSGQKIDEVKINYLIEDLSFSQNTLYALENSGGRGRSANSRLNSFPVEQGRFKNDDGPFLPRRNLLLPGYRQFGLGNQIGRRLFVGDDFAFVTDLMGFNRIDLRDPQNPTRKETHKTASRGWRHMVSNGSGLAISIEHRFSPRYARGKDGGPSIYTVQNNGDFLRAGGYMENFETRFPTPGNAGAVSIYNGLAYIADGTKGLQVVNYRAYDINGIKPTLSVTLNDMNGTVEEAKLLTLRAFVQDDIQVKNVDFFVDGEKVFVDGGYPFAHTLEVPLRKDQATLRLRVIARDTGGNEAYWPGPGSTNEHTLTIADDLVPPQVVTYFPRENSTVLPGETVVAVFNERMAPDSIHVRSIRLDRLNDNNTTTPIELASVVYDDATQSAYATLPATLPPAKYQLYVNELATDLPSNPLKTPAPVRNLFGPSEIHGQFWFDRNHNTVQDSGEEILKEWTAFLDYNNNGEFDIGEPNATSDQAGNYSFTNLYPGGYSVAEVLPHGWTQTFPKGQNLGATEQFTNVGWISESDQSANQTFAVDTLGNGWTAGIIPDGNFSIGSTSFDGNGTAGQLFIARVAPTGLVDKVVSLGNPDINNTGLAPNLILKPDIDAGIWLTGSFSGNGLSIPGASLDANSTTAFATRFDQDLNASLTTVFPNSTISDLSPDPDGRVAIAGTFTDSTTMGTTTLTSNGGTDAFIAKIASTGKIAWAKSLGGSQWETVQSITSDVNGSLWIAGDSNSSNFTADTTNLDLSGNAGGYLAQYNQSGSNLWAIDPIGQVSLLDDSSAAWFLDQNGSTMLIKKVSANGTITSITSITGSIVTDLISTTDGGVNVSLSTTSGTISVNGVNVSANTANSGLLLKLKSNGDLAWSIPLSTNGSDSITQLARGSSPDTWAMGTVGTTNQSLTYGTKTIDLNSSTGVLLKIDPVGEVTSMWAIPVAGNLYIDVNDNVWVTGNNSGDPGLTRTITIGALPLQTESAKGNYIGRIGSAGSESHTIQLGSGEIQQNKNFGNSLPLIESRKAICVGGPNEDASRSVVTDPAGNAYYAGDFTGHTEFGGRKLKSDGQNDAMFVKFLPNGKIDWAKNFGGDGDDLGHAIFADDNGSLFASGTFQGTAKFGDFTLVSAGMRDIFVLRLDDNGTPIHAFRAGGPRDDDAFSLVADSNNSVYVGGAIEQTADFGPYQLTSQGNRDAYLLKLDYSLTAQWVGSLMSQDQAEIRSLTLDENNLPVAAGDFAGTLQLRGTAIKDGDSNSTYENNATAPSIAFNIISPSNNGTVDNNATLQITAAYLAPPVGYQSPTWAYRIDSGFPGYGSPHGGTQVNGNTTVANFMNGQAYGAKQIHVALLDTNGSLYNPPVTKSISVNYQSSGGGYQTPIGNYIAVGFPSSGSLILPNNDTLQVFTNYASANVLFVARNGNDISGIGSQISPFATISMAVLSASSGQTIIVKPGTYTGAGNKNIRLGGKDITIKSSQGPESTIIDCENDGRGFYIRDGETNANIIGFTIKNGSSGGVKVENGSSATFRYCNIIQNRSSDSGPNAGGVKGGTYWYCNINDNIGNGQGPWNSGLGGGAQGATIYYSQIRRNVKLHNDNETAGGAQGCQIYYSLITDNNSSGNIRVAGGVAYSTVTNSILYNNRTTASRLSANGAIGSTFTNNIVWNPANSFSEMTSNIFGNGNTDPQFINAGIGDFRFQPNSPMINTGDPSSPLDPDGTRTDIGFNVGLLDYVYPQFIDPKVPETPQWVYRIDSGFPGYGSPHGGTQVTGNYAQNFLDGQSSGGRQIHVALLDSNGSLHNPPVTSTISVNYQTGSQSGNSEPTEIWTFTNAGATGQNGPTQEQINSAYSGTNLANKSTVNTQGIQEWVVPQTGKYKIEASGARGGIGDGGTTVPSKGSIVTGTIDLTKGTTLKLIVGQIGTQGPNSEAGAGGGGTFVWNKVTSAPITIAGGGGGAAEDSGPVATGISSNQNGAASLSGENGGTSGGNGANGIGSNSGTGGLGWNSIVSNTYVTTVPSNSRSGGWGGGGNGDDGAGGGGGYSGGAGGADHRNWGGGGGSYNSGTEQIILAGANDGHGKVVISLLGNPKLESAGQKDFFVARFDQNGTVTDSAHGSGTGIEGVNGIAIGKQNEFYLTGIYGSQLSIGDQNATGGNNFVNTYLLQLNSDLSTSWIKTIGGGGFNRGESVAVSTKGTAFFTGSYTGTSTFDEGSLTSAGGSDVYLAEFDQRGNLYRLISHGGTMGDAGTAVALDNNGGIIMTGTYHGEADFFGGEHTCHEHGGTDVFVARYDYTLQAPETKYVVSVVQDENGTEKFLINNEEEPELELIPGLEYEFELDGNTTTDHPFTFTEEGTGGQDEAWDSKDDVNNSGATTGKIIVKVDEKTPDILKYKSGKKDDVGGVIKIKQNKTPSYRLTIAEFDDGLNNVDGANIVVTKNGQPVNLDEPFEKGTRLRVSLKPKEGFIFEGWQGDLPTDANGTLPSDETFVISMDKDRTLKAYFTKYAPDPRDFLNQFEFIMQAKQADEFGQPIPGGDGPNYMLVFTLDQGGIAADGTSGQMGVQPIGNQPDLDGDGKSDVITGRFIFDQINENQGVFQAVNPMVIYSSGNGTPEPIWGGGMELSFLFEKPNGKKEQGAYVMLKNDGTQEQGDFGSDQIRKDFSLDN